MARLTRLSMVLISTLALAAPSFAADTGMLYVKSNPSGATVVIAGKERGRTPVLVKGLPAGEFSVELRITGVKPVAKQVTVKANRVSTIDVTIDVPSASLTVLSDPLEARVFLDSREVGKTPLTLEHLDPGEHRLMLLKDGHPRTPRSVVLEPGGERVLEVKLGTAGSEEANDETERPAAGEPVAQAAKFVPVEVQLILTMLKEAVDKGNYGEARRNMALALGQADMANFKEELSGAITVVQALEMRQHHVRKSAAKLVGREVTLKTKTGPRRGNVEGTSVAGIAIVSKIMIRGVAAGETRATIKWSSLHPDESKRLATSWKGEGPDAEVARGFLALARKDEAEVARVAAVAEDHPLGQYLSRSSRGPEETSEASAREECSRIEKKSRGRSMSVIQELAFGEEILALREKYEGTKGLSSLQKRMNDALARAKRASGLVGHWTFDEGGGLVARDLSGNGNHGRIRGARWAKGKLGAALEFDGVDDLVDCGNTRSLNLAREMTIAAWMKLDDSSRRQAIASKCARGVNSWLLEIYYEGGRLSFYTAFEGHLLGAGQVSAGVWHHVAATYDGKSKRTYLDGAVAASKPTGRYIRLISQPVMIGNWSSFDRPFGGLIDDVRIYNRALSPKEVKALAAAAE